MGSVQCTEQRKWGDNQRAWCIVGHFELIICGVAKKWPEAVAFLPVLHKLHRLLMRGSVFWTKPTLHVNFKIFYLQKSTRRGSEMSLCGLGTASMFVASMLNH